MSLPEPADPALEALAVGWIALCQVSTYDQYGNPLIYGGFNVAAECVATDGVRISEQGRPAVLIGKVSALTRCTSLWAPSAACRRTTRRRT